MCVFVYLCVCVGAWPQERPSGQLEEGLPAQVLYQYTHHTHPTRHTCTTLLFDASVPHLSCDVVMCCDGVCDRESSTKQQLSVQMPGAHTTAIEGAITHIHTSISKAGACLDSRWSDCVSCVVVLCVMAVHGPVAGVRRFGRNLANLASRITPDRLDTHTTSSHKPPCKHRA